MSEENAPVTHEDLERAAAEYERSLEQAPSGEDEDETPETEPTTTDAASPEDSLPPASPPDEDDTPDEPDDHRERSKLGRRLAAMEANQQKFMEQIQQTLAGFKQPANEAPEDEITDEDDFVTVSKLDTLLAKREQARIQQESAYAREYQHQQVTLGLDLTEEEHAEIIKEMSEKFTDRHTGNPAQDARFNFLAAQNAVLHKKLTESSKPKNPLDKNKQAKPEAPLGGPTETVSDNKPPKPINLDPDAAEYARRMGMDEKTIREAIDSDVIADKGGRMIFKSHPIRIKQNA